jgi:hypothetical protein
MYCSVSIFYDEKIRLLTSSPASLRLGGGRVDKQALSLIQEGDVLEQCLMRDVGARYSPESSEFTHNIAAHLTRASILGRNSHEVYVPCLAPVADICRVVGCCSRQMYECDAEILVIPRELDADVTRIVIKPIAEQQLEHSQRSDNTITLCWYVHCLAVQDTGSILDLLRRRIELSAAHDEVIASNCIVSDGYLAGFAEHSALIVAALWIMSALLADEAQVCVFMTVYTSEVERKRVGDSLVYGRQHIA